MYLTVNVQNYPFADRGWHIVFGNAQKGSHIFPLDPMQHQKFSKIFSNCKYIATFSTGTHATSLLEMALYSIPTHFLMSFDMEWFSIFSSPKNGGLGFTSGVANQCSIFVLIDSDVWACLFQLDVRGYLRIQWHINLVQNTSGTVLSDLLLC